MTLDAVEAGRGVGTQLVTELVDRLKRFGIRRLWVTTTIDTISALAFYQKRSFKLERLRVDALHATRRLKSRVPRIAPNGIPLRDEIDLCRDLCD